MFAQQSIASVIVIMSILSFSSGVFANERCEDALSPASGRVSDAHVKNNEGTFEKSRGLSRYLPILGPSFRHFVRNAKNAGPSGYYLDAGGGEGVAARELMSRLPEGWHGTIIAYETKAQPQPRLGVIAGHFIEDISFKEVPQSDWITDVVGPTAYSDRVDVVLQWYANNVRFDESTGHRGVISLYMGSRAAAYGLTTKVITAEGRVLNLMEWMQTIPELETTVHREQQEDEMVKIDVWSVDISKRTSEVAVPPLQNIFYKAVKIPERVFEEEGLSREVLQERQRQVSEHARQFYVRQAEQNSTEDFLDSFRSGELTHPLLGKIKDLGSQDLWINVSPIAEKVGRDLKLKNYQYEKTNVFWGLAQMWMKWRTKGVDPDKFSYQATQELSSAGPQAQLITAYGDEFLSGYAPDKTLKVYLDRLAADGELFIFLGKEFKGLGAQTQIIKSKDERVSLRKWLETIPGLKVDYYRSGYDYTGGELTSMRIQIDDRRAIRIPSLEFIGASDPQADYVALPYYREVP